MESARESGVFERIIVSTDDADIAGVAINCGAELHTRSDDLSKNEVGTQAVMASVLKDLIIMDSMNAGYACCLYATNPMVEPVEFIQAHGHLKFNAYLNYVVPVAEWLKDPGRWYFGRTQAFLSGLPLLGSGTRLYPIDPKRAVDINTDTDWEEAERKYLDLHEEAQA